MTIKRVSKDRTCHSTVLFEQKRPGLETEAVKRSLALSHQFNVESDAPAALMDEGLL